MSALKDCGSCMQANDEDTRRGMGCGFELPLEHRLPLWRPTAMSGDESFPTTCPGYTVRLPQVIEGVRARGHWQKGQLESFLGGDHPSEQLMVAVEIVEGSANELERARMTPHSEGGLAEERR